MTLSEAYIESRLFVEEELKILEKQVAGIYGTLLKQVDQEMAAFYGRVMAGVKPEDFYKEAIKFDRLKKLFAGIKKNASPLFLEERKATIKAFDKVFREKWYRDLYLANWQWTENLFFEVPAELVNIAVLGTEQAWKEYTAKLAEKLGPGSQYVPQVGTLAELIVNNQTQTIRQVQANISAGLGAGNGYRKTAAAMKDLFGGISGQKARGAVARSLRVVQTESNRIFGAESLALSHELENMGLDIWNTWDASLDSRTRPTHGKLDGQKRRPGESFEADGFSAVAPGKFGIASQDINCRCSLIQTVGDFTPKARIARNPVPVIDKKTGKEKYVNEVIQNKSYTEWIKDQKKV